MQFLYKHRGLILSNVSVTDNQNVLKEWHMNGLEGSKFLSLYEYAQIHHRQVIHVKRTNNFMELVDQSARQLVEEQASGKESKPKSRQKHAAEKETPNEEKKNQVFCNHDFMDQQEEHQGKFLRVVRNVGQDEIDPLIPTLVFDEKINCGPIYCYPTFGKRKVILEDLYVGPRDQVWKYKGFA